MPKWFNTAGPCRPDKHYMLPAIPRLPPLDRLIAQESYQEILPRMLTSSPQDSLPQISPTWLQLDKDLAGLGLDVGWLVMSDQREGIHQFLNRLQQKLPQRLMNDKLRVFEDTILVDNDCLYNRTHPR